MTKYQDANKGGTGSHRSKIKLNRRMKKAIIEIFDGVVSESIFEGGVGCFRGTGVVVGRVPGQGRNMSGIPESRGCGVFGNWRKESRWSREGSGGGR